jgi:hypothetical protein
MGAFLARVCRDCTDTETLPAYQSLPPKAPLVEEEKGNSPISPRDELKELITQALGNGYKSYGTLRASSCLFTSDGDNLIGHVSLGNAARTIKLIVTEECVTLEFKVGDFIKFFPQDVKNLKAGKISTLADILVTRMA